MAVFAAPAAVDRIQLEIMRDELEDVRGEINSLIGQIEAVREDLYEKRCERTSWYDVYNHQCLYERNINLPYSHRARCLMHA